MVSINKVILLDELTSKNSVIHNLDGRVKLISTLFIIVFTVFSKQIITSIILEIFLLIIIYLSKISFKDSFKRIAMLLPFGGAIVIFQPFIHPGEIIWAGPVSWLHISTNGLFFGLLLLSRLIVCLTAITILSSTSPMQEITNSLKKIGMPKDFAMIISIMVRFLFIFVDELMLIRKSQKSRNFDIHSSITPYKWRVRQVGYTIAMMFLKAYEKGENIYKSMISRCFSENSELYLEKTELQKSDYYYIASILFIVIFIELILFTFSDQLGFFAMNLSIN